MKDYKVQKALGFGLYALAVALVSLAAYAALLDIKQRTLINTRDSLQTVLQTVQKANQILISESQNITNHVSQLASVRQLTQRALDQPGNVSNDESLSRAIMTELSHHRNQRFFVLNKDGINIASDELSLVGHKNAMFRQRPLLVNRILNGSQSAIGSMRLPVEHSADFVPIFFVSAAIHSDSGEAVAAFLKIIDPKAQFAEISVLGRIGVTGETYAFDRRALLLTDSRFDHHLKRANLIDAGKNSLMNLYITDPGGDTLQGFKPLASNRNLPMTHMAKQATAGISGFDIKGYRDYLGVMVFGAWSWDHDMGIGIASEINIDEALQSYYKTRNVFVAVIALGAIIDLFVLQFIFGLLKKSSDLIEKDNQLLEQLVQERTQELVEAQRQLSEKNQCLETMATTDELTKLANRRKFSNELALTWQRNLRDKKSIAVMLIDVDSFKEYNDNYGHLEGDICLTQVAETLRHSHVIKRPGDLIARYGGEEFVVVLDNPNREYVLNMAQQLCDSVRYRAIPHAFTKVKLGDPTLNCDFNRVVTISVGVCYSDDLSGGSIREILSRADVAMYNAKNAGRNCVREFLPEE